MIELDDDASAGMAEKDKYGRGRHMTQGDIALVLRSALWTVMKLAAPLLLVSLCVGLLVSVFQAATQIHEQTLTFVPKVISIAFLLLVLGSWMLTNLADFFTSVCMRILLI
ncbi:MAG: flagellar biosynthesis protein FliQ [Clostridiales bacterium]|nr:flagellar biosynthesis protein FliQ [Clostridiales bacterium]